MSAYDQSFFSGHKAGSSSSAGALVPLVLDLCAPQSVVDIGCGIGTWLRVFQDHGVADIFGVDGPWVGQDQLLIGRDRFRAADLSEPLDLGRRFDLAVSLEVAEHLPESVASAFVQSLTRLAPVVMFSAAIPGQGGTDHVNEQWPEFWIGRFATHGYVAIDGLRAKVWNDPRVQWWYAQNTMIFASPGSLAGHAKLKSAAEHAPIPLPLVHPGCLAVHAGRRPGLSDLLRQLPGATRRAMSSRIGAGPRAQG